MFRNWRDMVTAGRWRNKRRRPARHHVLMTRALDKLGLNYREYCSFYNKYGQVQYLDIVIKRKHGLAVILWMDKLYFAKGKKRRPGGPKYFRENKRRREEHLEDKGIPYRWMERERSTEEFMVRVSSWVKSLDKQDERKER